MSDDRFVHVWASMSTDERAEVPEGIKSASLERYNRIMGTPTLRAVQPAFDPEPEEAWPDPVDVFAGAAVPPLPLDALPEVVGLWAAEHACASGFDAGSYAYCALVAASTLIDHRARLVIADGFSVPAFLWGALVDFSGGGKSPILDAALAPIVALNNDLVRASRAAAEAHERENLGRKPAEREDPPAWKQILTNNATIEGLAALLQDNPTGVLLHSDELTEWLGRMDAFHGGGGKDRAAFLSAFNGGSVTVNRAKGNIYVPSFSIAIVGGIQPVRVAELLARAGAGDGLVQRFLPYCPTAPEAVTYGAIAAEHVAAYRKALQTLERWTREGEFATTNAGLSPQARDQHREYHNALRQLTKTLPPGRFVEHLHKLPGLAARVAFTLHALECAAEDFWRPVVDADTHRQALRLMRVFYRHAEAMYEVIDSTQERSRMLARTAAETILARTMRSFSWSDLTRHAAQWQSADETVRQAALDRLIELGWIMDVTPAREPGRRGRSSAGKFGVNPKVHDVFAGQADRVRDTRRQRMVLLREVREPN